MPKIIISAVNTRYTHTSIALAYLKAYWQKTPNRPEIEIKEFYLSQSNETIISKLILAKPDILAFSVYIWSIDRIKVVSNALKAALPNVIIIWGGPEVSYNSKELMVSLAQPDYIVRGEGEITFSELLNAVISGDSVKDIKGITYKNASEVIYNPDRPLIEDLDILPSPFGLAPKDGRQTFVHYEASRGCPSRCSYCLSSVQGKPRYFSLERVKKDLDYFFDSNYTQIRFADRTFNHNKNRAEEIIKYICLNCKKKLEFHFEIQADFLSPDLIRLFAENQHILFHLEIGVQSTNEAALKAVNRFFNLPILKERVKALRKLPNVYLHLDLLGGIVNDTFESFCKSFNDVFALRAHDIQISLVKVLKGTPFEKYVADGLVFAMNEPPYTVLRTKTLSPSEAVMIQDMGKLVEGIYNRSRFNASVAFIVQKAFNGSAAAFFIELVKFWRQNDFLFYGFTPENTCDRLAAFAKKNIDNLSFCAAFEALTAHELCLGLKSAPVFKSSFCPSLEAIEKRHKYRLTTGLKTTWASCDVNELLKAINNGESPDTPPISSFPMVYRLKINQLSAPEIVYLELPLEKAFVLASIQAKVPILSCKSLWQRLYPKIQAPKFDEVIKELLDKGLIYESSAASKAKTKA